nr:CFF_HP1_G0031320.mRNA.1.CDS.1 [Saccharomyces cerevisiae]
MILVEVLMRKICTGSTTISIAVTIMFISKGNSHKGKQEPLKGTESSVNSLTSSRKRPSSYQHQHQTSKPARRFVHTKTPLIYLIRYWQDARPHCSQAQFLRDEHGKRRGSSVSGDTAM